MKLAVIIALACSPAAAQTSLIGTWCSEAGDQALFIAADSMGIGDHRVCDWANAPTDSPDHETRIACRQIYFDDSDEPVVIGLSEYQFTANLNGPYHMRASFDDGSARFSYDYTRCDG